MSSGLGDLFSAQVAHIGSSHLEFFSHWYELLSEEEHFYRAKKPTAPWLPTAQDRYVRTYVNAQCMLMGEGKRRGRERGGGGKEEGEGKRRRREKEGEGRAWNNIECMGSHMSDHLIGHHSILHRHYKFLSAVSIENCTDITSVHIIVLHCQMIILASF